MHALHMHAYTSRGQRPRGMCVHACLRPRANQGRGKGGRLRPKAETSMFCARVTLPRFHMRDRPLMHTA
eukprot:366239-Chlamydomonas_euryale.AAC.5